MIFVGLPHRELAKGRDAQEKCHARDGQPQSGGFVSRINTRCPTFIRPRAQTRTRQGLNSETRRKQRECDDAAR